MPCPVDGYQVPCTNMNGKAPDGWTHFFVGEYPDRFVVLQRHGRPVFKVRMPPPPGSDLEFHAAALCRLIEQKIREFSQEPS